MIRLFMEGGIGFMGIVTLALIALFLAAWKAPAWVKEFGLIALVIGFLGLLLGLHQMSGFIAGIEETLSPAIMAAGIKVALIPPIYGCFVYLLSLIIRIIQKPRLM